MNDIVLNKSNTIKNSDDNVKYLEDNLIKIKYKNLILRDFNNNLNFSHKFDNNKCIIKLKLNKKIQKYLHLQFKLDIFNIEKITIDNKNVNLNSLNEFYTSCTLKRKNYTILEFYYKNSDFKINIHSLKYLLFKPQNIKIDKIYIINLIRCSERKQNMIAKLENEKIHNYEFIDAIDKNELTTEFENLKKNKKTQIITAGHYACSKSHIKVLNKILDSEYENVLILEDDVMFRDNFIEKINNLQISNYDIVYFGGLINHNKLYVDGWAKQNEIMGMYAYMVNKNIIPNIIQKIETFETFCDVTIKNNFQHNAILLNDIIYTNLDSSDTSEKSKNTHDKINKQLIQLIS